MSLAEALKKPVAPLYLEETSTWPPPGPMALVFADKSYIDFRSANVNDSDGHLWTSKEFDKGLVQLKAAVPEVQIEKPRRHLIEMNRPTTAVAHIDTDQRVTRPKSGLVVPQSRACSIM